MHRPTLLIGGGRLARVFVSHAAPTFFAARRASRGDGSAVVPRVSAATDKVPMTLLLLVRPKLESAASLLRGSEKP